ncbi:MAG: PqqD family peptide modification chaperone [Rubrivivax sp.]|nr:PqqD family peptide modification chaperone [Pyrinomonadaceae bacterium]
MASYQKENGDGARASGARPRARAEGLVAREVADETLVYDLESHRAVCLNKTAALVWRSCDGRKTAKGIARTLGEELGEAVPEEVVWLALDQLGRDGLLETRVARPEALAGLSRRELIRRVSLAAAIVALPLVTSIVAPTPAQAASCVPTGGACTLSAECCPNNVCVGNVCVGGP